MAVTVTSQANPIANKLVQDTDANATAAANTTGALGVLYYLEVDNTLNAGQIVYFKMVDDTSVTVGTTSPVDLSLPLGLPTGVSRARVQQALPVPRPT